MHLCSNNIAYRFSPSQMKWNETKECYILPLFKNDDFRATICLRMLNDHNFMIDLLLLRVLGMPLIWPRALETFPCIFWSLYTVGY